MFLFKTTIKRLEDAGFKKIDESLFGITFLRLRNAERDIVPISEWTYPIGNVHREEITLLLFPSGGNELLTSGATRFSDKDIKLFLRYIRERRIFS